MLRGAPRVPHRPDRKGAAVADRGRKRRVAGLGKPDRFEGSLAETAAVVRLSKWFREPPGLSRRCRHKAPALANAQLRLVSRTRGAPISTTCTWPSHSFAAAF